MKITVRAYLGRQVIAEASGDFLLSDLPVLAAAHIDAIRQGRCDTIELEFLDEPDPRKRFSRIAVSPLVVMA